MDLTNDTTLRGYLTHVHAEVKKLTKLYGEWMIRGGGKRDTTELDKMRALWTELRTDTYKVLSIELLEFDALFHSTAVVSEGDAVEHASGADPLRIRLGVLKRKADKARLKDPSITLLKSWDLEAHKGNSDDKD